MMFDALLFISFFLDETVLDKKKQKTKTPQ